MTEADDTGAVTDDAVAQKAAKQRASGARPLAWAVTDGLYAAAMFGLVAVGFYVDCLAVRWEEPWAQRAEFESELGRSDGAWRYFRAIDLRNVRLVANHTAVARAAEMPPNPHIINAGSFADTHNVARLWCYSAAMLAGSLFLWTIAVTLLFAKGRGGPWLESRVTSRFPVRSSKSAAVWTSRFGVVPVVSLALGHAILTGQLARTARADASELCSQADAEWKRLQRTLLPGHELHSTASHCEFSTPVPGVVLAAMLGCVVSAAYALLHALQDCAVCLCDDGGETSLVPGVPDAAIPAAGTPQARKEESPQQRQFLSPDGAESREMVTPKTGDGYQLQHADGALSADGLGLLSSQRVDSPRRSERRGSLRPGDAVHYKGADGAWRGGAYIESVHADYVEIRTYTQKLLRVLWSEVEASPSVSGLGVAGNDSVADREGTILSGSAVDSFAGEALLCSPELGPSPPPKERQGSKEIDNNEIKLTPGCTELRPATATSSSTPTPPLGVSLGSPSITALSRTPSSGSLDVPKTSGVRRWLAKWSSRRGGYFYYAEDKYGELGHATWNLPADALVHQYEGGPRAGMVAAGAVPPLALHDMRCPWVRWADADNVRSTLARSGSQRVRTCTAQTTAFTYDAEDALRLDTVAVALPGSGDIDGVPAVELRFPDGATVPWRCCDLLVYTPPQTGGGMFVWRAMDRRGRGWLSRGEVHHYLVANGDPLGRQGWPAFVRRWTGAPQREVSREEFTGEWDRCFSIRSGGSQGGCEWQAGMRARGMAPRGCGRWRHCIVMGPADDGCYAVRWEECDGLDTADGIAVLLVSPTGPLPWPRRDTPPPPLPPPPGPFVPRNGSSSGDAPSGSGSWGCEGVVLEVDGSLSGSLRADEHDWGKRVETGGTATATSEEETNTAKRRVPPPALEMPRVRQTSGSPRSALKAPTPRASSPRGRSVSFHFGPVSSAAQDASKTRSCETLSSSDL